MLCQQGIVIVGAGIVGLSTAYALLSQGMQHVTVLEQEAVDHRRCSSHGSSRLLRFEYGADSFYTSMVRLSLKRWRSLEQLSRRTLYTPTGLLMLGTENDNFTQPGFQAVQASGLPIERLSREDCGLRFPQFDTQPYDTFTYNHEGGILHASTCLLALRDLVLDLGGAIYESCRVTHIISDSHQRPVRLRLSYGNEISADRVVLATGSWVHRLLADLHLPVRLTRQYLLYFAGLPFSLFSPGTFPVFIAQDLYGFPIYQGCNGWLKAASHKFGLPVDPDEVSLPDQGIIAQITGQLRELLPALHHAELARIDSCTYDVTPDEDFILDHLPHDPRIIFATGFTGHGFKFGVLLGELLSSMVRGTQPAVPLDRFRLSRFTHRQSFQTSSVA